MPNVRPPAPPAKGAKPAPVTVTVSKCERALTVVDDAGSVVLYAPVTVGSSNDPLPIGDWKVTGVQRNPVFHYNPDLFWDADPSHAKAKVPAGPNNPVGVVWVDLSRPHYGLHGTPEPSTHRPHRIARLRPAHQLGCVARRRAGRAGHAGAVSPVTSPRQARVRERLVAMLAIGFCLGALATTYLAVAARRARIP